MKKTSQGFVGSFSTSRSPFIRSLAVSLLVVMGISSPVFAYTTINSQLDPGETNADVTSLQVFFSDNASIYPSKLITGYFGSLTKAGVLRFQALYGLDQVGRVGPVTRDKINSLINNGGWTGMTPQSDLTAPSFLSVNQNQTTNSATFTFTTNEVATARVVYYTNPLMFNEGDINSSGFGPIGGYTVNSPSGSSFSHSVTLPNLQSNTVYYYTIIVTDQNGNVSVWGPNNTFRTSVQ